MLNTDEESIRQLMLDIGIKPTRQRIDIARTIMAKPQHFSAEQVSSMVNNESTQISKATIYNTLNLFVEKGLIKQVLIDPAKVFFDSNTANHGHIFNEDTGDLVDFNTDELVLGESVMKQLPENSVQSGIDIIVRVKKQIKTLSKQ